MIARFILTENFDRIPLDVIKRAKESIIDCLGVMILGSNHEAIGILEKFIKENNGVKTSSVIGKNLKTSAIFAAFINGTMAHVLDFDDFSVSMSEGHPTAPTLAVVLALGEKINATGKEILEAYILGAEVEMKIGSLISPDHADKGWHTTGTLGTLGAAVTASKLLKLNLKQIAMALGIAVSQASGIIQNFGSMTKSLHVGAAAKNGIIAASLSKKGFTSSNDSFEGENGFCSVFYNYGNRNKLNKISEYLGNPYDFIEPGIEIKLYPCCSYTHGAINAILKLKEKYKFTTKNFKKITCGISYAVFKTLNHEIPKTDLDTKFNIPFCISLALVNDKLTVEDFSLIKLNNPEIREILGKIEVYIHPNLTTKEGLKNDFTLVTIFLSNGEAHSMKIDKKNASKDSLSYKKEIISKYVECTTGILSSENIKKSISIVDNLENLEKIQDLTSLFNVV